MNYVKQNIKPGSIILLHPMYDDTGKELQTIEGILKALSDEGYTFVTVNELQELYPPSKHLKSSWNMLFSLLL